MGCRKAKNASLVCLSVSVSTFPSVSSMLPGNKTYQSVSEACHENVNWIWEFHFHFTNYLMRLSTTDCKRELKPEEQRQTLTPESYSMDHILSYWVNIWSTEAPTHFTLSNFSIFWRKLLCCDTPGGTKTMKIHLNLENSCWQPPHSHPHGGQ